VLAHGACSCGNATCGRDTAKHPRTEHGVLDATTDTTIIGASWMRLPDANIAGRTAELFDVLDIDDMDVSAWERLTGFRLPHTWQWRTGSGGRQLAFVPVGGLANGVKRVDGADTRAKNGYAILPPSRNRNGAYAWIVTPDAVPLAAWPADLLTVLMTPKMAPPSLASRPVG
jgi:Bifunctional DNA primase/polymerase, N-terminal